MTNPITPSSPITPPNVAKAQEKPGSDLGSRNSYSIHDRGPDPYDVAERLGLLEMYRASVTNTGGK